MPYLVECCVVRPDDVVAEFVQHGTQDMLIGEKPFRVSWLPQPHFDFHASIHVQSEQRRILRIELREREREREREESNVCVCVCQLMLVLLA